jgi:tetratricopeptide (TPR) repeat protein
MPSIESIDKLKRLVQNMGDEPAVRQKMGMPMEDISPPESALDPDISSLLGDPAPSSPGDMDSFLGQRVGGEAAGSTSIPQDDLLDAFQGVPDEPEGSSFDEFFAPDQEALEALGLVEGQETESFDPFEGDLPDQGEEDSSFDLDDALGALGQEPDEESDAAAGTPGDFDLPEDQDEEADFGEPAELEGDFPDDMGPTEDLSGGEDLSGFSPAEEGQVSDGDASQENEYVDAFGEDDPLAGFGDLDIEESDSSAPSQEEELFDDLPEPDDDFDYDDDPAMAESPAQTPGLEDSLEDDFAADDIFADTEALLQPEDGLGLDAENPVGELGDSGDELPEDIEPLGGLDPSEEDDLPEDTFEFGEAEDSFEIGEALEPAEIPGGGPQASPEGLSPDELNDSFFSEPGQELSSEDLASALDPDDEAAPAEDLGELDEDSGLDSGDFGDDDGDDFAFDDSALDEEFPELAGFAQITEDNTEDSASAGPEEFSLPDFSSHFGLAEGETDTEFDDLNPANLIQKETGEEELILNISDEEFMALQRNLSFFPLNLRIAVEETIGEKIVSNEDLSTLIRMLITGASVRAVARHVGEITNKVIDIPPGYEKGTGEKVDARRNSMGYQFSQAVLPIIRNVAILGILVVAATLLFMNYIWTPFLYSAPLYEEGLALVQDGQFEEGESKFALAVARWRDESWFYRYADAYKELGNFDGARTKYQQILLPFDRFSLDVTATDPETGETFQRLVQTPDLERLSFLPEFRVSNYDRKALMEWAEMESLNGWSQENPLIGYMRADRLLGPILRRDERDLDALLMRGDNFLRWTRSRGNSSMEALTAANTAYSSALSFHGYKPDVVYRFMDFFIYADRAGLRSRDLTTAGKESIGPSEGPGIEDEVLFYRDYIFDRPDFEIRPREIGKMGGYLIEKFQGTTTGNFFASGTGKFLDRLPDLLLRAVEEKPSEPLPHYQLARYNRIVGDIGEEKKALAASKGYFDRLDESDPTEFRDTELLKARIDTWTRMGEVFWREGEVSTAIEYLQQAQRFFEDGVVRQQLESFDPMMGRIFSNLGNIYYYQSRDWSRDSNQALGYLENARDFGFDTPEDQFKRGVIYYNQENLGEAIDTFYLTQKTPGLDQNRNLLWAMGNSLLAERRYGVGRGLFYRTGRPPSGAEGQYQSHAGGPPGGPSRPDGVYPENPEQQGCGHLPGPGPEQPQQPRSRRSFRPFYRGRDHRRRPEPGTVRIITDARQRWRNTQTQHPQHVPGR